MLSAQLSVLSCWKSIGLMLVRGAASDIMIAVKTHRRVARHIACCVEAMSTILVCGH